MPYCHLELGNKFQCNSKQKTTIHIHENSREKCLKTAVTLSWSKCVNSGTQIARFMGPTWGPPGSCRPQMGPMLAPWTLLSGWPIISGRCQYLCLSMHHDHQVYLSIDRHSTKCQVYQLPDCYFSCEKKQMRVLLNVSKRTGHQPGTRFTNGFLIAIEIP